VTVLCRYWFGLVDVVWEMDVAAALSGLFSFLHLLLLLFDFVVRRVL
jgi:hypothetical protein